MSRANLSRRAFLGRSVAVAGVGATFAIGGTKSSGRVIGANDTIRVAVAGPQRPGRLARRRASLKMPGVEIAYLVDPDTRTFAKRIKQVEAITEKAGKSGGIHPPPRRTSAACSTTSTSTPSRSPRPTTGTR